MPPGGPLGELITRLLWQRGVTTTAAAEAFLEPTLAQGLRPPSMLAHLAGAAERVADALAAGRTARIDCDASLEAIVAATALRAGLPATDDDDGVTIAVGARTLTVDGTLIDGSVLGLDVAGTVFYLLIALRRARRDRGEDAPPDPRAQIDLVALSSLAAGSTLRDEQRVLVALGLRRMSEQPRPGLSAIVESAMISRPTAHAVRMRVVPRLAAAVALGEATRVRSVLEARTTDAAVADATAIELAAARWRAEASTPEPPMPDVIVVDGEWSLAEATGRLMFALARLEPHGPGNPEPVLVARGARLDGARLAGDPTRPYWRLRLRQDSHTVRAVAQHLRTAELVVGKLYDVAYTPRQGHVRGGGAVEITVHDLHEHTPLATGQAPETTG